MHRYYMSPHMEARANALGGSNVRPSWRKGKKLAVDYDGRVVHFGAAGMSDYTQHRDPKRRLDYQRRHGAIRTKDGRLAYTVEGTPAYFSWYLLW